MYFPYLCFLLHLTGHMLTRAFLCRAFHGLAALPAVCIHTPSGLIGLFPLPIRNELTWNNIKLINWCFTARQHKIGQFVPIYQGWLLAQAFEDSQRETYKNIVACDTMNILTQRQTTGMPYLLKEKQCIQQITRPRMGKKSRRALNEVISNLILSKNFVLQHLLFVRLYIA